MFSGYGVGINQEYGTLQNEKQVTILDASQFAKKWSALGEFNFYGMSYKPKKSKVNKVEVNGNSYRV